MGFSQSADTIKIVKLPDEYVYEVYMNQTKLIFRFGFLPQIFHFVYGNIKKIETLKSRAFLVPSRHFRIRMVKFDRMHYCYLKSPC